jgi:photosystem II stability/assembly factor-like uncharacterized protein
MQSAGAAKRIGASPSRRSRCASPLPHLRRLSVLLAAILVSASIALAHDGTSYGGVYRSRDAGATWLGIDVGLFLRSAASAAVDPTDPAHLLLGTDAGLLRSSNGGRSWAFEPVGDVSVPVTAVAFGGDGKTALVAGPGGVYRWNGSEWSRSDVPPSAAPAREILSEVATGRYYLLGRTRLFVSEDDGRTFRRVADDLPSNAQMTAVAVLSASSDGIAGIVDDRVMVSTDGGRHWADRAPAPRVDVVTADVQVPGRLWSAAAEQLFMSDDVGLTWRKVGRPLPDPGTEIRGIAADGAGEVLVTTTQRGMYRSTDGGQSWAAQAGGLPAHQEAGALIRDPAEPATLLALYSLVPYGELWRGAVAAADDVARRAAWHNSAMLVGAAVLFLVGMGLLRLLVRRRRAPESLTGAST